MKPYPCFVLFFFLLTIPIASQTNLEEALEIYNTSDYENAIINLTKVIESSEKDKPKALLYRADSYVCLGNFKAAKSDLDWCLQLDSKTNKIHYFYGRYYTFSGDQIKAVASFTEAIKMDPKDDQSYDGRAIAKMQMRDYKGAIADDDIAIAIFPTDHTFYNNRGFAKSQLGLLEEATKDFDISISIAPSAKAFANKAKIYTTKELYALAIDYYSRAIELKENDPLLRQYRGQCHAVIGDFEKACIDFTQSKYISEKIKYYIPDLEEDMRQIDCL